MEKKERTMKLDWYTTMCQVTGNGQKKKKRKRDASLFLAANNPCTFLDHAESRWCLLPFKEVGAKGHSFKVPPRTNSFYSALCPNEIGHSIYCINSATSLSSLLIFVLPLSTSCFSILWIILRRRRRKRRRISSLKLAFDLVPSDQLILDIALSRQS